MKRIASRMIWVVSCAVPLVALGGGETQEVIIEMQDCTDGYSMSDLTGEIVVNLGNPGKFSVRNAAFEQRSFMEYDLSPLCRATTAEDILSASFEVVVGNNFPNDDVDGILDFYAYEGDGEIVVDDWEKGDWFADLVESGWGVSHSVDATSVVRTAVSIGWTHLGIRISTDESDLYRIGKIMGASTPNPLFVIQILQSPIVEDVAMFVQCMGGPDDLVTRDCRSAFDFDCDGDVDLLDFSVVSLNFGT